MQLSRSLSRPVPRIVSSIVSGPFLVLASLGAALCVPLFSARSFPAAAPQTPEAAAQQSPDLSLGCWPSSERDAQLEYESALLDAVDNDELSDLHELFAIEPHVAGTPGDQRVIEKLAGLFEQYGLEVEKHAFWTLLARHVSSELRIISPVELELSLKEDALAEDAFTNHPELALGWNAYSGSGEVSAQVVYANHGTKQDFELLEELGVSCLGKIVIARYGGNFRGYKAKFAEKAGAAGLIIYTDPEDSGYGRGLPYPEGGYANPSQIQRGSIKTLPYLGDPLTPFVEATEDAERLDPRSIALPRIPVQPVGWAAAQEILGRMRGESVPADWQGGLPFRYRLTGGPELVVRLAVEQKREVVRTYNVLGTLTGGVHPEQRVVIGCHHDAWGFGASDPTCGLICVVESARVFAEAAKRGHRPQRSVTFAAWGAEEFGIIGSVEWVESRLAELRAGCVAYINLDAAATGPNFGSSASPSLQQTIADAARHVSVARDPDSQVPDTTGSAPSIFEDWSARSSGADSVPDFGDLGGGSDHVGFLALAGVPSAGVAARGSPGSCYHSNYDTLTWYRKVVGSDYEPARIVTQVTTLSAVRLANAPLLPIALTRFGPETLRHLESLTRRGRSLEFFDPEHKRPVAIELARVEAAALKYTQHAREAQAVLLEAQATGLDERRLDLINANLIALDRAWLSDRGIPGRPWFKNLFAATDESSGYGAWMLPALRYAIEHQDQQSLEEAEPQYLAVFERMSSLVSGILRLVAEESPGGR